MWMEQKYTIKGHTMVYYMPREVDHHQSITISSFLDRYIESGQIRQLVFDFGENEFMDSSGIGILIGRSRTLGYYGGKVYARRLSGRSRMIFAASGLQKLIEVVEEEQHE